MTSSPQKPLPVLSYGDVDTRYGVVTERLPDGGVRITVPSTVFSRFNVNLRRNIHPAAGLTIAVFDLLAWLTGIKDAEPRAVITLDQSQLTIHEPGGYLVTTRQQTLTWPTPEVGDVRRNRYSRSLYVRIRDKDTLDLLGDVPDRILTYVGGTLETTLKDLRAVPGTS